MSQYCVESEETRGKYQKVLVGWDSPLETFFAQVWTNEDDEEPVFWTGNSRCQWTDIEVFIESFSPWFTLPASIKQQLIEDQQTEGSVKRVPAIQSLLDKFEEMSQQ
ncbi:MAG: hypothetical protein F6K14_15560 [Symploca sp. SIO2C1]|nr:hypothetical protein [Symploca sp. SIO2C1]